TLLGGTAAWPLATRAQQPRVGGDPAPGTVLVAAHDVNRVGPSVDFSHGNLVVHSDGHRLRHTDGTPFVLIADTCWNLVQDLAPVDQQVYFDTRRAQGFTAIQTRIISVWYDSRGTKSQVPDFYGNLPFLNNDITTPNEAFFANVDAAIDRAAAAGLYLNM